MFFKKLEAKKEEKEKKEPFEKILLRDKTSSGFYFFWDSFQPPSAFFLWLEIKNQFYSNTLSHDAGNLNFRCNSNVFFWGERGGNFKRGREGTLRGGGNHCVCEIFFLLRPELLLFFGMGDVVVVVGPRLQSLRLSLTRDEAGEKLLLL